MKYRMRIKASSQDVPVDIVCGIVSRVLEKKLEECKESITNNSCVEVYIESEEKLKNLEEILKRYGFISYEVEKIEAVRISKLRIRKLTQKVSEDLICELLGEILGEVFDQTKCKRYFRLQNYLDIEIPQERKKAVLDALRKLGYVYVEDLSKQESVESREEKQSRQAHTEQTIENQKEHGEIQKSTEDIEEGQPEQVNTKQTVESKKEKKLPFKIFEDAGAIAGGLQLFVFLYYAGQAILFFAFLTTFVKVGNLSISLLWLMLNAGLYFNFMFVGVVLLSIISSYLTFTKRFATALVLTFMQLSDVTSLFIYTKLNLESIKIYLTFVKFLASEAEGKKIENIIPELGPAMKLIVAGSILSLSSLFYIFRKNYNSESTLKEFRELASKLGFGNITQAIITMGLVLFFFFIALSFHREMESRRNRPFEEDLKSHISILYNSVGISSYKENYIDMRTILFELLKAMDEGKVSPESIKNKIEDYKLSQFHSYISKKCDKTDSESEKFYDLIGNKRNINCDYKKIQSKFIDILYSLYYIADKYREIMIFERDYRRSMEYMIRDLKYSYSYEELYLKLSMLRSYKEEMDQRARKMEEDLLKHVALFVKQSMDYIKTRNSFAKAYNLKIQPVLLKE